MSLNSLSSMTDTGNAGSLAINQDASVFNSQLSDATSRSNQTNSENLLGGEVLRASDSTPPPALNAELQINWNGDLNTATGAVYVSADGKLTEVLKENAPKLFALLKDYAASLLADSGATKPPPELVQDQPSTVNSEDAKQAALDKALGKGATLADSDLYLGASDIDNPGKPENGLIELEGTDRKNGQSGDTKYIVDQSTNPELYDRVAGLHTNADAEQVSETREEHGLGKLDDLDILSKKSSDDMTVSQKATTTLLDKYTQGIADGSIGKDDPKAKLVMAIEAQGALQNGRGLTGYVEDVRLDDTTYREMDEKKTQLTAADEQDIIDGNKVDARLTELFANEDIASDYKQSLSDAISTVPDRDKLVESLVQQLTSPEYTNYLQKMNGSGHGDIAQKDVSALVGSLTLLDPVKAKEATDTLTCNSLTVQLDSLQGDASKVSAENKELAIKDVFAVAKAAIKNAGVDVPKRVQDSMDQFVNGFLLDKAKSSEAMAALDEFRSRGVVTEAEIKEVVDKTYIPSAERAKLKEAFSVMNSQGILSSLSGTASLVSGIYQLVGQGGKLSDDPLERVAISKDFISFLSNSSQFIKTGMFDSLTKNGAFELLGLDKTLPEIWDAKGPLGSAPPDEKPYTSSNTVNEKLNAIDSRLKINEALFNEEFQRLSAISIHDDVIDSSTGRPTSSSMPDSASLASSVVEPDAKVPMSMPAKLGGSALKVLGAVTDFAGGALDVVLGAFNIKAGIEKDDSLLKVAGSLQVVGGATGVAAGGIGIAGLLGATAAAVAVGPLFLVGAALGIAGAVVSVFSQHKQEQDATNAESDWYADLDKEGLLQSGWQDKIEYARYAIHHYGQRDTPDDQSMFDYQSREWNHFKEEDGKNGSSINRLDGVKHVDYEGDGDNKVVHTNKVLDAALEHDSVGEEAPNRGRPALSIL